MYVIESLEKYISLKKKIKGQSEKKSERIKNKMGEA